ncbi:MAG: hypothetical protein ACRC0B_04245 [Legionella sp.]
MPRRTYSRAALLRLNTGQAAQAIPNLPLELKKRPTTQFFGASYVCKPVNDRVDKEDLDKNPPAILCK